MRSRGKGLARPCAGAVTHSWPRDRALRYPTDVGLLRDVMRRLIRATGRAATEQEVRGWRKWKHLQTAVACEYLAVQSRNTGHPLLETWPRFFILPWTSPLPDRLFSCRESA